LEKVFGSEIADAVSLLSKNGLSDEEYKNNIQKNNKILTIKAYDRRHNIASLLLQPDQQKKDRYIQKTETELLPIFKNKIPKQAVKIENILSYIKTHNNMPDIIQERIAANKKIISLQGEL
jgi:(p)ppGpp synthase/HD superfamily hydrolase